MRSKVVAKFKVVVDGAEAQTLLDHAEVASNVKTVLERHGHDVEIVATFRRVIIWGETETERINA